MNHETNLPTQQAPAEEKVRVSRSNEDHRRAQGDSAQAPSRAQSAIRLTFSSADRLHNRREFERLKKGKQYVGKFLILQAVKGERQRLGITASSRYGNAVERNRLKRQVREAFRTARPFLPSQTEFHVIPRQEAKKASMNDLRDELLRCLS